MLTHRQLRYFIDIVGAGSFSLAAERLFIAQSALSRQVKEMEQTLGVPLLERGTRHLQMTPAGRSLYDDARRILAALQQAAVNARHAQRGVEGTVRVLHASSVPISAPLQHFLRSHIDQYPGVSVEVSQASSEQQAAEIAQGRADLGLARARAAPLPRHALRAAGQPGPSRRARPCPSGWWAACSRRCSAAAGSCTPSTSRAGCRTKVPSASRSPR